MIRYFVGAFITCLGYGLIFNVDLRKILYACLNCGIGYLVYNLCLPYGNYVSLIISSFVLTVISEILARYTKSPVTVFLVCSLIPLVPGMGAYYTVLHLVNSESALAVSRGFDTLVQAGSIVLGVSFATNIFKAVSRLKKH